MAAELGAAQGELSASLIELRGVQGVDPALVTQGDQQLAAILSLQRRVATAGPKQLITIRAEIAVAVSNAANTTHQAQQAAASTGGSGSGPMATARQGAQEAVHEFEDAYFKQRKFDPYLRFKSEEDEREFRQRETERQMEIERALAMHTAAGDLKAAQLSKEQLLDAGAHGADKSPDYKPALESITTATNNLQAAINAKDASKNSTERLDAVESSVAASEPPEIPPGVLAALRQVRTPDDGVGHGLDGTTVATAAQGIAAGRS